MWHEGMRGSGQIRRQAAPGWASRWGTGGQAGMYTGGQGRAGYRWAGQGEYRRRGIGEQAQRGYSSSRNSLWLPCSRPMSSVPPISPANIVVGSIIFPAPSDTDKISAAHVFLVIIANTKKFWKRKISGAHVCRHARVHRHVHRQEYGHVYGHV